MIPRHVQIVIVLLVAGIFAGAFYGLHLERRAARAAKAENNGSVAPSIAGTPEPVKLWIAYDEDGVFRETDARVDLPNQPSERAKAIVRALLADYMAQPSPHALAAGSDVKRVYLVNGLAVLDMSPAFADNHRSGALIEEFTVTSIVASLSANMPEVKQVKFLIDGKERESLAGHADLLGVYDVDTVNHFVQGLQ